MIIDSPESHFIFVFHPSTLDGKKYTIYEGKELSNGEVLTYWGKWLVLGTEERINELAYLLDPFVEDQKIPCIKYDRVPSKNLGIEERVLMVYCDRRERDDIWKILKGFGAKMKIWVTEKETMELWVPGGLLLERWLDTKNLDRLTKIVARENAGAKIQYIFDHPDEIYEGWVQ